MLTPSRSGLGAWILAVASLLLQGKAQAQSGSGRVLEADRTVVRAGDVAQIYVRLRNPGGVANMDYGLTYDAAVVQPEGEAVAGNLLQGSVTVFAADPRDPGLLRIGFARPEGLEQTGTVAVIPFRAVGPPGSRTPLGLEPRVTEDARGEALRLTSIEGEIVVAETRSDPETDPTDPTRGATCAGDRSRLDPPDARCALRMSVGLRAEDLTMDVDANRQVTSGDARIILQRVTGRHPW